MHLRWRLDNQDGFADSPCGNVGKQNIDVERLDLDIVVENSVRLMLADNGYIR
jgi:hypothetical protein